ncbi:hypothetical protein [Bacillus sp. 165]|uniref:hypothetical protein n=1 Tax=Bacillus sp. 165 TaxID=1529117 RepID=UPI001ADBC724|nr:hypothetical protein [Bacillus sp. 165]MBO9128581.1 hypothetical protein [Bacillus sp. 165]
MLQPAHLNSSKEQFNNVFRFTKEGNIIEEDSVSGKVKLKVDKENVANPEAFRRIVSKLGLSNPNLMFYRFTSWYLMRGESIFAETSKDLAVAFNSEMQFGDDIPNKYNDTNINAWKKWACFLGYGFQHGGIVIPNTDVRLIDLIADSTLFKGEFIPFAEFMGWLASVSPELDGGELFNRNKGETILPSQHLSLGLSSGLRTLHDQGVIELHYQSDALDTWFLTRCNTHEIVMEVSEIKIGR